MSDALSPDELPPWSRWYREAREEMAFRYGLRRIPVDTYKQHYGLTPQEACKAIWEERLARGD